MKYQSEHASQHGRHELRTLYHSMLLRARRMFEGYVSDRAVTADEVRALTMYM
jgi:hypothetical protein